MRRLCLAICLLFISCSAEVPTGIVSEREPEYLQWEEFAKWTYRLPVFGGWMVVHDGAGHGESAIFVPDRTYKWEIGK